MSRAVVAAALLLAALVGVVLLRQETMSVHTPGAPGTSTTFVVTARTPSPRTEARLAAMTRAQVALCRLEVHDETVDPRLLHLRGATFEFRLRPVLDESDRRALHGCLEDARVDHLQLRVERVRDHGTGG